MNAENFRAGWLALAVTAVLFAGCVNLKPAPDPTRFFSLGLTEGPSTRWEGPQVMVELAPHLRSSKLVVRRGAHEIVYDPFARWTGSLDTMIRERLSARLDDEGGWQREGDRLEVQVLAFEGLESGSILLSATWLRRSDISGAIVGSGHYRISEDWKPPRDRAAMVDALASMVDGLAQAISKQAQASVSVEAG